MNTITQAQQMHLYVRRVRQAQHVMVQQISLATALWILSKIQNDDGSITIKELSESECLKIDYEKKQNDETNIPEEEFIRNAKLPFELLRVYEKHAECKRNGNELQTKLVRKQLDNCAVKYDELLDKAKEQNNKRFENFFRRQFDSGNNS